MDYRIELMTVPVTDVDRAKAFYVDQAGFHADHDQTVHEGLRFVQLTPPGSACSIAIGEGLTSAAPGSIDSIQMVVTDIEEAQRVLTARGCPISAIDDQPWGRFLYFQDPDGNQWAIQQLPPRD
ncbi:MAG: VOC family protein [Chloroflexi bacterium]|nr:VOC family protein [Chloroflexota bacterium]